MAQLQGIPRGFSSFYRLSSTPCIVSPSQNALRIHSCRHYAAARAKFRAVKKLDRVKEVVQRQVPRSTSAIAELMGDFEEEEKLIETVKTKRGIVLGFFTGGYDVLHVCFIA